MIFPLEGIAPSILGFTFFFLGAFKTYGLWKGIHGGSGSPPLEQLCGT